MTEFRFTDEQWREYQQMPEQGYSHRGKLEWFVNSWLHDHDRDTYDAARAEGFEEGHEHGWEAGSDSMAGESNGR